MEAVRGPADVGARPAHDLERRPVVDVRRCSPIAWSIATRRTDFETESAVMQEMSRNVASSGTGESVTTIGAVALTCAHQVDHLEDVAGVLLHRRQPEHVAVGIEDLLRDAAPEHPARFAVLPDLGQADVKTNAPASANARRTPRAPPRRPTPGSRPTRGGRSGSPARSRNRSRTRRRNRGARMCCSAPSGMRSVRREQPGLAQERAQLAGEAGAESDDQVVRLEHRLQPGCVPGGCSPGSAASKSSKCRRSAGKYFASALCQECDQRLLRPDRAVADQEADVPGAVGVGDEVLRHPVAVREL